MAMCNTVSRVTPWADWSEWRNLKRLLSKNKYAEAQLMLDAYFFRRRQSVPIALATTVTLVNQLNNKTIDAYTQRLGLSMAITRFVNGLTDKLQPRSDGASARSVYALAVELGLPLILVDIRHQASHNLLPRLSTLESGARQALVWLETNYWVPQEQNTLTSAEVTLAQIREQFLPEHPEEIANLFHGIDSDTQSPSFTAPASSDKGSNVLSRLNILQTRIEKKRLQRESKKTSAAYNHKIPQKRWRLCENSEEWQSCPIGITPKQRIVPRSIRVICTSDEDDPAPMAEISEVTSQTTENSSQPPQPTDENNKSDSQLNQGHDTSLPTEFEEKVLERQNHFSKLLAHIQNCKV